MRFVAFLAAASVSARLELAGVLQDGLLGAGIGAIFGRILIVRLERSRELAPRRVRQIEITWACVVAFVGVVAHPALS